MYLCIRIENIIKSSNKFFFTAKKLYHPIHIMGYKEAILPSCSLCIGTVSYTHLTLPTIA